LAIALAASDVSVAVGVVLAAALKLFVERLVRRQLHSKLEARVRPGTSETAVSCIVDPVLPVGLRWVPFLLTALVMLGRVYVGAHNPLDATAGLGAGLLLGGLVAAIVH